MRLFPPAAILEHIGRSLDLAGSERDAPERHRSLRGTIDWSHDLLEEPERRLFRRLAPFAGGWTFEDAAGVVDIDRRSGPGPGNRARIVSRQEPRPGRAGGPIPRPARSRFSLHPLIREFALDRLAAAAELAAIEAGHARVYATVAEQTGAAILGPRGEWALRRLDHEQYNVRAAIDWSLRTDDPASALRIVSATWRWYQQRGRLREARALLAGLLDGPAPIDPRSRIAGLAADGGLAYWMDDIDGAGSRYRERLRLADELGDPALEADANYDVALPLCRIGRA